MPHTPSIGRQLKSAGWPLPFLIHRIAPVHPSWWTPRNGLEMDAEEIDEEKSSYVSRKSQQSTHIIKHGQRQEDVFTAMEPRCYCLVGYCGAVGRK